MWATDASYFRVVGWVYYYLVTVMDDYSRFILAHRLQRDMTSDSFIEVVQDAVDRTGNVLNDMRHWWSVKMLITPLQSPECCKQVIAWRVSSPGTNPRTGS